jgi:hypothetical protein
MSTPIASPPFGETLDLTPEDEEATRAIIEKLMTGKPLAPAVERRIRERGERIAQEILEKHGVQNNAVELIREVRDEE